MKKVALILIASALAACSSGGSSPISEPMPPSVENASPGGFWVGTDSDGEEVIAIIGEDGLFYFLAGRFKAGSGLVAVSNGEFVHGNFLLPKEDSLISPNQKLGPDCNLNGLVAERNLMTLDVKCKTEENQQILTTLALNYDTLYELESSPAIVTGNYKYTIGMVLSIDASGIVFGQDAVTGCVINGHVAVINTDFNLYDIGWSNTSCVGQESKLNGRVFDGLALLDNTVIPNQLIIAVSSIIEESILSSNIEEPILSSNTENPFVSIISFAARL